MITMLLLNNISIAHVLLHLIFTARRICIARTMPSQDVCLSKLRNELHTLGLGSTWRCQGSRTYFLESPVHVHRTVPLTVIHRSLATVQLTTRLY